VVETEPASRPEAINGDKSQQQQQPKQGGSVSGLSMGGVGFNLLVDSTRDFVRLLADNEEAAAAAAAAAKVKQGSSTSGSVSPFAQVGSKKNLQQPQQPHHRQAQQLSAPPSAAPTPQTQKNFPTHSLPPKPPDAPSTPLSYDDLVGLLVRVLKKGSQKKQWMKLPALKSAFHRETGLHLKPALFATALAASSPPPPPSPPPSLSHLPSAQGGNSGESRLGDVGGADNRGDNSGGVLPVAPSTLPKCNDNDGHPSCPTDLESILDGLLCVRGEPGAHGNSKARWRFVEGAPTPTSTE